MTTNNEELKPLMNISEVYFSCTQCGKCCESNFPLTFEEMFKYKDDFIQKLRIQLHLFPAYLASNEYAEVSQLFRKIYIPISLPDTNFHPIFISIQSVQSSYESMCPKLDGNKCSIYDNRPLNCKSLPLEATLPDSLQSKHYVHWILAGGLKKFECNLANIDDIPEKNRDNKVQAELFINWNKEKQCYEFNNTYYTEYKKEQDELMNHFELKQEILQHHLTYTKMKMSELYQFLKKEILVTHVGSIISGMIKKNYCTKQDALAFFQSQVKLIQSEIAKAKARKNKEERVETKFLSEMHVLYNEYIKLLTT